MCLWSQVAAQSLHSFLFCFVFVLRKAKLIFFLTLLLPSKTKKNCRRFLFLFFPLSKIQSRFILHTVRSPTFDFGDDKRFFFEFYFACQWLKISLLWKLFQVFFFFVFFFFPYSEMDEIKMCLDILFLFL